MVVKRVISAIIREPNAAAPRPAATGSAANVGANKDGDRRQRQAISTFAKRAGFEIVAEFYDAAVSGADPIQDRPGFSALLIALKAMASER